MWGMPIETPSQQQLAPPQEPEVDLWGMPIQQHPSEPQQQEQQEVDIWGMPIAQPQKQAQGQGQPLPGGGFEGPSKGLQGSLQQAQTEPMSNQGSHDAEYLAQHQKYLKSAAASQERAQWHSGAPVLQQPTPSRQGQNSKMSNHNSSNIHNNGGGSRRAGETTGWPPAFSPSQDQDQGFGWPATAHQPLETHQFPQYYQQQQQQQQQHQQGETPPPQEAQEESFW